MQNILISTLVPNLLRLTWWERGVSWLVWLGTGDHMPHYRALLIAERLNLTRPDRNVPHTQVIENEEKFPPGEQKVCVRHGVHCGIEPIR